MAFGQVLRKRRGEVLFQARVRLADVDERVRLVVRGEASEEVCGRGPDHRIATDADSRAYAQASALELNPNL
jgi:hypothetical protein